jgi:hypothetical protein
MANEEKIKTITVIIGQNFRSFGGGQASNNNPLATALRDEPYQFAAGVDIKSVVEAILKLNAGR